MGLDVLSHIGIKSGQRSQGALGNNIVDHFFVKETLETLHGFGLTLWIDAHKTIVQRNGFFVHPTPGIRVDIII